MVPGRLPERAASSRFGTVSDWVQFQNQYYWLQYYVDVQVGRVLTALDSSSYAAKTIVIFASDHGEFAGSHGMHDKAGAVYEETLHVPLYVHFPGQMGETNVQQMCSGVDFFGLVCDLATSGSGTWREMYPDLAPRQAIWSFLCQNAAETRLVAIAGQPPAPYVLHTVDETASSEYCPTPAEAPDNRHITWLLQSLGAWRYLLGRIDSTGV